jgi:hypothetical protein
MKSKLSAARTAFSIIALASSLLMHDAIANPVTIQLQEDGVNGGAITTVAAGDGLANVAGLSRMACSGSISPATVATQPRATASTINLRFRPVRRPMICPEMPFPSAAGHRGRRLCQSFRRPKWSAYLFRHQRDIQG